MSPFLIGFGVVVACMLLFVLALMRAADRADRQLGYKDDPDAPPGPELSLVIGYCFNRISGPHGPGFYYRCTEHETGGTGSDWLPIERYTVKKTGVNGPPASGELCAHCEVCGKNIERWSD